MFYARPAVPDGPFSCPRNRRGPAKRRGRACTRDSGLGYGLYAFQGTSMYVAVAAGPLVTVSAVLPHLTCPST